MNQIEIIRSYKKIVEVIDTVVSSSGHMYFAQPSGIPMRTRTSERFDGGRITVRKTRRKSEVRREIIASL